MTLEIPQRGRARYHRSPPDKQRDFLNDLEQLGSVDQACGVIRFRRDGINHTRRDDPRFRAVWANTVAHVLAARVNDLARGGAK